MTNAGKRRLVGYTIAVLVAVSIAGGATIAVLNRAPNSCVVEARFDEGDIGIAGISHLYFARITNKGRMPVFLDGCDYLSDAMARGTTYAYVIQRWDSDKQGWQSAFEFRPASYCQPYPLGWVKARWTKRLVWPGQSVNTEWEATGARDIFHKGDIARFAVLGRINWQDPDKSTFLYSAPFRIADERSERDGPPLRVQH